MPLPVLNEEQRRQALQKAAEARRKRAEVKQELKSGKRTLPASSFGSVAGRGCCVLSNCCFDTAQRRGHGEHSEN